MQRKDKFQNKNGADGKGEGYEEEFSGSNPKLNRPTLHFFACTDTKRVN